MTDQEILELIYSDRSKGLSELIDTHSVLIYQLVADILLEVGNEDDVFECVCDSFEAFYNNIDDVDLTRGSIRGYLGVIANRRAINLYFTLKPDSDSVFSEYTVEEMSDALENAQQDYMPEVPHRVKLDCLVDELAPETEAFSENITEEAQETEYSEYPEDTEETSQPEDIYDTEEEDDTDSESTFEVVREPKSIPRIFKIIPMAVALVAVIAGVILAVNELAVPKYEKTTTTAPATLQNSGDPILSAIISGHEKLIESLITNSLLLSQDIATFAIENAGKLSYETIRHITEAVNEKFGTTGLDSLLESAILGDSQKVMDELEDKDKMEMTPSERLAFFFSAAFGNSQVIEEFIEKGFDASLKDSSGKTIFDIAGIYGNDEILKWRSGQ